MSAPPPASLANGLLMPRLAVGTHKVTGQAAEDVIQWALDAGYSHIDTASVYKNETEIGLALRRSGVERSTVFITSKLSPYEHGFDKALAACENSLERLGTPYLDLYLVHWPGVARTPPASGENARVRLQTWKALEQLYSQGKCRAIGVSNFTVLHLEHLLPLCQVRPMVNQVELHPLLAQSELREFCERKGIHVQAYSPFGCGQLLGDQRIQKIADDSEHSPAQVLLRWSLSKNCTAIPKTTSKERLQQNKAALDIHLSAEHMAILDSLDEGHHFCWSPEKIL